MWEVRESPLCRRQVRRCPKDVLRRYEAWRAVVELSGPNALRKIPGFRDHALKGDWKGARSSSLTKKWRVLYTVERDVLQVMVLEVNPHDY